MQKYSSKNTSVNTGKNLPAVYRKINWNSIPTYITHLVDWGCGKDTQNVEKWLKSCRIDRYVGYDPNWRTKADNDLAEKSIGFHNIFVCSNVLNVIDDDDIVKDIVEKAISSPIYFVTVYEGSRSGVGRQSKDDCYQRNCKTKDYLKFFPYGAVVKNSVITNRPDLVVSW